ncbi:MAG: energy coupling factor transporter S component ThiW [Eubacteriales bacterium]
MKRNQALLRMVMLAMLVAIGVVISPILRVEGMCPMAHFINITCSVLLGPWYSLLCAAMIGVIRMVFLGIPPLALTGAVFGAALSGIFYRLSRGRIICACAGETFGTGIIGAIVSYPVMAYLMGRSGLTLFYYVPSFIGGTLIGGAAAFVFLTALLKTGMLKKIQNALGAKVTVYEKLRDKPGAADDGASKAE